MSKKAEQTIASIAAAVADESIRDHPYPAPSVRAAALMLARRLETIYKLTAVKLCWNQDQAEKFDGRLRRGCVGFVLIFNTSQIKPVYINLKKDVIRDRRNHLYLLKLAGEAIKTETAYQVAQMEAAERKAAEETEVG